MRIGEIAKQAGVSVDTLRYYERRGIITKPDRRRSGYREYPPDTARVIRFIKRAQDLGFALDEIEELLRLRTGGKRAKARPIAEAKIQAIDEKVRGLRAMRAALAGLVESCSCGDGAQPGCPIIEALDDGPPEEGDSLAEAGGAR